MTERACQARGLAATADLNWYRNFCKWASDSRVNERVSFSRITCRPEMSFRGESVFMTAARELSLVLIHGMFGDFLDREPVLEPPSRSRTA